MRLRTRAKTAAAVEEEQEAPEEPEKPDDDDDGRSATPESDGDGDESRPADEPIPAENAANARKNKNTNEMQQMWEVPAVAHFCSLFRATFKLVDFDIEDLEEALAIDSDCAEQGGRSSLLVDLLIGLLKGCIGRRDITLLNYNQFLHDLLELQWVGGGLGVNPLGLSRDKANFHTLPVHVKVKLLHGLCEWRLERPDVETLTKNLTGESLRVNPLGQDDQGNTYWYFYGTRLYKEEPEPVKIRIATTSKKKKRGRASQPVEDEEEAESDAVAAKQPPPKTTTPQAKKRKRRPGSYGASSSKRKKRKVSPTKKSTQKEEQSGDEKVDESVDSSRPSTPSVTNAAQAANSSTKSNGDTNFNQVRRQLSARAEAVARSGRSSPSSEANGEANGGESYRDLIERIYSRDEDEDTRDTPLLDDSRRSSPVLDEASRQSTKMKDEPIDDGEATADETMKTADADQSALKHEDTHDSTALSDGLSADDKSGLVADDKNGLVTDDKSGLVTDDQAPSQSTDVDSKDMAMEVKDEKQLSPEPVGPPPYEQELLRFDAATDTRWYVVCKDMMDWKALADSFRTSRSKLEKMLYSILKKEFLPSIEEIYAQKEKEQEKKLAALIAKRTSDRLEVKRLQREEEIKELEMREKAEWERLAQIDLEKRRKAEQQTREQRQRQRELDRERQHRLKMRAKEERSRRLALRQRRQEISHAGGHIPAELMGDLRSHEKDDELDEIDIELELEMMYGQLEKVLDMVKDSPDSEPFLRPVSADVAPDYADIITKPMDLQTMESKLLEREYRNKFDFIEDMNNLLLNCLTYNGIDSEYTKLAQRIERVFIRAWKRYFPPSEVLENERIRLDEIKCVDMLGALDKRIRELLKDSDEDEEEPPPPPPPSARRRTAPANTPRLGYPGAAPSPPQMIAVRPSPGPRVIFPNRKNGQPIMTPGRAPPLAQAMRPAHMMQSMSSSSSNVTPVRRVAMSDQGGATCSRTLPIQAQPMRTPTSLQTISTVAQRTPQSPDKGNVYLLSGPDGLGNRLFRFVTKDGRPAPNDLVQLTMPQIRRDVLRFPPKQLVTVTIDDRTLAQSASTSRPVQQQQQYQQSPMTTHGLSGQRQPQQQQQQQQLTVGQPMRQIRPATSMVRVVQQQQQPVAINSTIRSPPSTTTMPILAPSSSSSAAAVVADRLDESSPQHARIYSLGQNNYLQVVNGTPFMLRKNDQTGGFERLRKIDKQELVSRLKQLREQKPSGASPALNSIASIGALDPDAIANCSTSSMDFSDQPTIATIPISSSTVAMAASPAKMPLVAASKPICSVAPFASMRSPQLLAPTSASTSQQQQSTGGGGGSNNNSVQLMIPSGQQIIVSGSQPTLLLTSAPTTTTGTVGSPSVQYIQLQVPANAQYVVVNSQPTPSTGSNDSSCQQ